MGTRSTPLCALLPPLYAQRLAIAAELSDHREIDQITDELAATYPDLVRPRSAAGVFRSLAEEKMGAAS